MATITEAEFADLAARLRAAYKIPLLDIEAVIRELRAQLGDHVIPTPTAADPRVTAGTEGEDTA